MKTLRMAVALAFLLSTLILTPAFAGTAKSSTKTSEKAAKSEKSAIMESGFRAHQFLGEAVKNAKGEELGKVSDFVFDQSGKIEYVILAHRQGVAEKLIPIPYDVVKASPGTKFLTVDISKDSLMKAPILAKNEWKEFDNPEFTKKVHSYYESERSMKMEHQGSMKMEHQGMKTEPSKTEQPRSSGY